MPQSPKPGSTPVEAADESTVDAVAVGRRIRGLRKAKGLTLDDVARGIGRAPSQVSVIENGRREAPLSVLTKIAETLGCSLGDLLAVEAVDQRTSLEIELERIQRGPAFRKLQLPALRVGPSLTTEAMAAILGLHRELERIQSERSATPEEARRANAELRQEMRARDNYFEPIEQTATELLAAVGYSGGPLSQRVTAEIASYLGFSLHYVSDVPKSTRSVSDLKNRRIYLPQRVRTERDPRSAPLHALASHILGHDEPTGYAEFLRQRVEANYLAAALLMPEQASVDLLRAAKDARRISVEDFRDAFAVSYETASHRFTNLATRHLGLPVHFMKVHESGAISKAYENDDVCFPTDSLGAIEGQSSCRNWTSRTVFSVDDRFNPYYQYTDTPTGTYWCTSRVQSSDEGEFSVSVGVSFEHVRWFQGRDTPNRGVSHCPDARCCRQAPSELRGRWEEYAWPTARPHASLLTALPQGVFPGVDDTEVYEFLEAHAPR
ncbi:helix-turn-helix transcriptional regulator [Lysinibacter cavernae]|uniref:Putative transcriptional regulator/DNA-binding Xre family transcriptional regulator n=1 Tax=Lysinibacter cavernae TaxID=1640652 RepID=A0A7X5TSA8_9MICO|nr:helix-turn-helix transcriptional regulator [Lysinibacter cavernae]NIH52149.1 putative transcriptional regulator/DNA-binding Xre family transcriptional regulator [Lysinibacter cavernae]